MGKRLTTVIAILGILGAIAVPHCISSIQVSKYETKQRLIREYTQNSNINTTDPTKLWNYSFEQADKIKREKGVEIDPTAIYKSIRPSK